MIYPSRVSGMKPPESVARMRGLVSRGWLHSKTTSFSLTEVFDLVGFSFGNQRGEQKQRQSVNRTLWRSGPRSRLQFHVHSGFFHNSSKKYIVLSLANIRNGKTKGLATRSQKQYTFKNIIVLHKEAKNNTLLKTVLFYTGTLKTIHF